MSTWQRRIVRDMDQLRSANFLVLPEDGTELKLDQFRVLLQGPADTPYAKGQWHIRFTIPTTYPFSSPSVGFVEHILHPNIDWASGSVCLDALSKKWSPVFTLKHIMDSLLPYLLAYPNPDDPLNRDAAAVYKQSPELFAAKAIEATKRYAVHHEERAT